MHRECGREALDYRICRKNFSSRAGTFRRGIMMVNFADQGLKLPAFGWQ